MHLGTIAQPTLGLGVRYPNFLEEMDDTAGHRGFPRHPRVEFFHEPGKRVGDRKRHAEVRAGIAEFRMQKVDDLARGRDDRTYYIKGLVAGEPRRGRGPGERLPDVAVSMTGRLVLPPATQGTR